MRTLSDPDAFRESDLGFLKTAHASSWELILFASDGEAYAHSTAPFMSAREQACSHGGSARLSSGAT
jgi:hypothetical protein